MPGVTKENELAIFHQEVAIMWSVSFHDNVISTLGYCENPNMIITELLDTDLMEFISTKAQQLTPPVVGRVLCHIAQAMVEIHKLGIIHRDLKSANVLLEGIASPPKMRAKICDFGIARNASRPQLVNQRVINIAGLSILYASPEAFARIAVRNLTPDPEEEKKTDVYSFAIIVYEVLFRTRAWDREQPDNVQYLVRSGKRPPCNRLEIARDPYLSMIYDLMVEAWDQDPARRPGFPLIANKLERFR